MAAKPVDARELLTSLGGSPALVVMMVQYIFITPLTSDPDMQGVKEIIRLLQRGLNAAGVARLDVDGVLGADTAKALNVVSPPFNSYAGKTWLRLLNDVSTAVRSGKYKKPAAPASSSVELVAPLETPSLMKSPVVLGVGVFLGLYFLMGKKRGRR